MGLGDFISGVFGSKNTADKDVDPRDYLYGNKKGMAESEANYYRQQAQAADSRAAPTANYGQANRDYQQSQGSRASENQALALQRDAAMGNAPSAAQIQMQQGTDQAIQAQLAAAASAHGTGPAQAAAMRAAQQQGASMSGQAIRDASMLKAQEQAQARSAYAQQANALRQGDLASRGQSAEQAQFQAQQELASRNANDARAMQEEQNRQNVYNSQLAASQNYGNMQAGVASQNAKTNQSNALGLIGMGASLAGSMSDARAKTEIQPVTIEGGADAVPATDTNATVGAQSGRFTMPLEATGAGGGVKAGTSFSVTEGMGGWPVFARRDHGMGDVSSDERGKSAGGDSGRIADAFLNTLKDSAATYEYKDPSNEPRAGGPTGGRYLGVMAQDLERVPEVGHQLVSDTPRGKMVEGGAGLSALMGGMGRLTQRLEALEARKGSRRG